MKKLMMITTALLIAGSATAFAQGGGGGGEPAKASDANPPAGVRMQPGESSSAPTTMPTDMQTAPVSGNAGTGSAQHNSSQRMQGPETGSAMDKSSAPAR